MSAIRLVTLIILALLAFVGNSLLRRTALHASPLTSLAHLISGVLLLASAAILADFVLVICKQAQ